MAAPDLSSLSEGQRAFYESLLQTDPASAQQFLDSLLAEQQQDERRSRIEPLPGEIPMLTPADSAIQPGTFMGPPAPLQPDEKSKMQEQEINFFEQTYQRDPYAAREYLEELFGETGRDAGRQAEVIPPPVEQRTMLGFSGAEDQPAPPSMQSLQERKQFEQAQTLIIPELLDEATQQLYGTTVERYVKEGFPDEDALYAVYENRFNQARESLGENVYDVKQGEITMDPDVNEYILQKGLFIQGELDKVGETAQDKAKQEVFGVGGPRKPRSAQPYDIKSTPVEPGMIQRKPELADEMSLGQLAKQALSPQVIRTGTEQRQDIAERRRMRENLIDGLVEFGKQPQYEGRDISDLEATREVEKAYFESLRDQQQEALVRQFLGAETEISPLSSPFFYGYSSEEMDALYDSFREDANAITQQLIEITYRPDALDDPRGALKANEKEVEYKKLFPYSKTTQQLLQENLIGPASTFFSEGLASFTTSKYSPQQRQMLIDAGMISDPDALTESVAMTTVRDIGGLMRLVTNPMVSGAENLGLIDRKPADEEVETWLPAQRREYTEDVEWYDLTGLGEAYLKEVLVETATMRNLGNDIAQTDMLFGLNTAEWDEGGRNALVVGGTIAEMFIPVLGEGSVITKMGKATGTLAKTPRALYSLGSAAATRTMPKMIPATGKAATAERLFEYGLDLAAGGGNPLWMAVKATDEFIPDIARNSLKNFATARDISKIKQGATEGKTVAGALEGSTEWSRFAQNSATVQAKIAENLSDTVYALELRASGAALDDAMADGVISLRSGMPINTLSPAQAEQALKEIALMPNLDVLATAAERALIGRSADYSREAAIARKAIIRDAAMEELTKFGFGDYILLTDRTVVSKKWLDANKDKIQDALVEADGTSKLFDVQVQPNGRTLYSIKPTAVLDDVTEGNAYASQLLAKNIEGGLLTIDETVYLTNRYLDNLALQAGDTTAFVPQKAATLERATEALERRGGITETLGTAYRGLTPTSWQNGIKRLTNKAMNKPTNVQAQTAETSAATRLFQQTVDDGIARMEQNIKGAFGQTARNLSNPDFALPLFSKDKTSQVYHTVLQLQLRGFTLQEISIMTAEEMQRGLTVAATGQSRVALTFKNQTAYERYVNTFLGAEAKGNEAIAKIIADGKVALNASTNPVEAALLTIDDITQRFPNVTITSAKRADDVVASIIYDLETQALVRRALNESYGSQPFALSLGGRSEAVNSLYGYSMAPSQIQEVTTELVTNRFLQPDGATYKGIPLREFSEAQADLFVQSNGLTGAYRQAGTQYPGITNKQFLEALDGGYSQNLGDYLEITALKRNVTPQELANNYGLTMRELSLQNKAGSNIMFPLTEAELNAINTYTGALTSGNAKVVADNIARISRNQDILQSMKGVMDYSANGIRRSFISGQLGGKMVPNVPYQMENLFTANLLAYVTNPKYWPTVAIQTIKSVFGVTPYRQLRYMAAMKPNSVLPGTRYTYAQVYQEFQRRNLGVSNAGLQLGDSFYSELAVEASGWNKFTKGTPGYQAIPETLKDWKGWGQGFLSYTGRGAQDVALGVGEIAKPFSSTMSPYMRWADNADRAFREAVFVDALKSGESVETAAKLSREVLLDYGALPPQARQGILKGALYLSFTYATSAEIAKALTTANGALRVSAMCNFHQNMSRQFDNYYANGDQTLQAMFIRETSDPEILNLYMRSPWMGSLITYGNAVGFATGVATGRAEDVATRTKEGLADFFYMPALDFVRELDTDYKKGVPAKQMFRMQQGIYDSQFLSLNPFSMYQYYGAYGANEFYFIDRYDIEVRPTERRVPGAPTFDGYQYRFRSKEGYNNYLTDQLIIASSGIQRGFNDYYNALVLEGLVDVPEGVDLGYQGKIERPLLTPSFDYLFLRARPTRLPSDLELEYRLLKEQQRRVEDQQKRMEK